MKKGIKKIEFLLPESYHLLEEAASRTDGISGIPSGFKYLDKMTSGWQNGELIAIGARPSMGKTAFVLSMLKNMAIDFKIPVMLFSLECKCLRDSGRKDKEWTVGTIRMGAARLQNERA